MAVNNTSISEYKCLICMQLLIEPVVLPCKHEMCRPCFRTNVEQANFVCPLCRRRISSWARKGIREGTLVDQNRWNLIQKLFPKKCLKRLQGDDDESEDECMYIGLINCVVFQIIKQRCQLNCQSLNQMF